MTRYQEKKTHFHKYVELQMTSTISDNNKTCQSDFTSSSTNPLHPLSNKRVFLNKTSLKTFTSKILPNSSNSSYQNKTPLVSSNSSHQNKTLRQLETKITKIESSGDVKELQEEVELLANINQLLEKENDDIHNKLNRFEKYRLPSLSQETTTNFWSTEEDEDLPKRKRRKSNKPKLSQKVKGKRKCHHLDVKSISESSEYSEESSEENEKNERRRGFIEMKAILKGVRKDYNLNYENTFNSSRNIEIRGQFIEELRKAMASKYRPSCLQWSYVDQNDMILNTEFKRNDADEYERNDERNEENERDDDEEEVEIMLTGEAQHSNDDN
ncbi:5733_t:CDS:2 [Funneliformis caledonium]|uniref:5733_t:CDS:1 n=1 Tax=Funneliformis caledonium TaxID=1117310 RepID=A0A9N9CWT4_9GLOM|nr:5733_t:CDS:2 [Funneliformis caledonium]